MPRRRVKASDWVIDEEAEWEEGLADDATARKDVAYEEKFEAYDPLEALGSSSEHVPPARKRRGPTVFSEVNVTSVLAGLYDDEEALPDLPDVSGYRFQRDPAYESAQPEPASVFTDAEKAHSAARKEDARRDRRVAIDARTKPLQNPDLGDADASDWIPHVFTSGGGSVAWFRSRDRMTPEERAAEDAAADRAEGIVRAPSDSEDEDVRERVERVDIILDRPRGVKPAGRRAMPVGGVSAPRGIPHEPPHLRGKTAVVTRRTVLNQDGEMIEMVEETADADERSPTSEDEGSAIVRETTKVETTARTVTMDERGNIIDESETRVVRGAGAEAPEAPERLRLTDVQLEAVARKLRENHGVEAEPREIAALLSRLRTKKKYAGVDRAREDEDDDADRAGRVGDDAATNAATRGARSDADSVGSGRDEDILTLIGKLAAGVFYAEEEEEDDDEDDLGSGEREGNDVATLASASASASASAAAPRPRISPNVVYDRRLQPRHRGAIGGALGHGAAVGLYERAAARRGVSRGAWRTVRRADDPGPSSDAGRPAAASVSLDPAERRRIVDAELRARVENTPRLRALSAKQRWTVAGAVAGFLTDTLAAARVAAEYRAEEEKERESAGWGWSRPRRTVIQRRKLVDKDGNVVETSEEVLEGDAGPDAEAKAKAKAKAEAEDEIAAAVKKCTCHKHERPPIVSGGIGSRRVGGGGIGGSGKHQRTGLGAVQHCPVHFPSAPTEERRPAPRVAPNKTHALTGDRGGGATQSSRDDDAGYVLYQTEQFFYLASHDHTRNRWRLAKISRRSDSLAVEEHGAEYDREQLKQLMSAVHKGNEGTGGLEIISKGSGVVAFVELSATTRDEDPSAAAASGPDAVERRAREAQRARAELAKLRAAETSGTVERAEVPYSGGRSRKTSSVVVFSGATAQSVRRRGRVRTRDATERDAARKLFLDSFADELVDAAGRPVLPTEDEVQTLDPGDELALGNTRVRRLTVGHAVSSEPIERLGIGKEEAEKRARERQRERLAEEEAEAARRAENSMVNRFRRGCAYGFSSAMRAVFGEDAFEKEELWFDKRERILRERAGPTLQELRDARLHDVSMELPQREEPKVEDGPLRQLADWFGEDWWFWNRDEDDEKYRIHPRDPDAERLRDPMLVKLRFRRYEGHARAPE